jgi:hypothetical protein
LILRPDNFSKSLSTILKPLAFSKSSSKKRIVSSPRSSLHISPDPSLLQIGLLDPSYSSVLVMSKSLFIFV